MFWCFWGGKAASFEHKHEISNPGQTFFPNAGYWVKLLPFNSTFAKVRTVNKSEKLKIFTWIFI